MDIPGTSTIVLRKIATHLSLHHRKRAWKGSIPDTGTDQIRHEVEIETAASTGRNTGPVMTGTPDTLPKRTTAGQLAPQNDDPRRASQRKHSQPSIPLRDRGDKPTRSQHTRRNGDRSPSPPPRPSKKRDSRGDRDSRKDHHHSTGSSRNNTTSSPTAKPPPRRPSLSHSQTTPYGRGPKKPGAPPSPSPSSPSHRSFSFLKDPRFMTAAEAALQAGATAALASAGSGGEGKWGGDKGAKVLGASLSAAALSALKNPPAPAGPESRGRRGEDGGGGVRYVAGREDGRGRAKRRH
ncbi:hypothetical protein SLS53_003331 [Cytospora paraplurivora]|uniref:Uncharacterized protein n=1 Tax=Cytospora paraplurivora TaxID=2898453 RepID=A0AAN9UD26_9PEZI